MTGVRTAVPSAFTTVTVRFAPVPDTAAVGTERAPDASPTTTWMAALRPLRRSSVGLVIVRVAAYCTALPPPALPPPEDEPPLTGRELTDRTCALRTLPDMALSVTVAACPGFSLRASASEKFAVTCMPDGLVSTTKPEREDEEPALEEAELPPEPPLPPTEPPLPPPLVPETVSPAFAVTEATVPAAGAFSTVPSTARCAASTAFCACVSWARAWATCAGSTVGVAAGADATAEPPRDDEEPLLGTELSCPASALVTLAWAAVSAARDWASVSVAAVASTFPSS